MQKKKLTPLQIVGHVLHTAILGVLAVVMAVLLFAANVILPGYARMVNAMLGYKKSWDNSKVQTDGLNLDYNTSDYTADNIGAAEADLTDRINSEGVVLLKNDGGLPLAEGTTVSLFSANSNQNAGAGLMGGGTPLNTALASHGLNVNETLWNFYSAGAGAGYGLASGSISFGIFSYFYPCFVSANGAKHPFFILHKTSPLMYFISSCNSHLLFCFI